MVAFMGEAAKDEGSEAAGALRRSARWTGARRETYLAVLRATGNARAAAEAIGMDRTTIEHRLRRDPDFARDCEDARAAADRRLRGAKADEAAGRIPDDGADAFEVVRRGPDGRLQIVAAGRGRWNKRIEDRFLVLLRETGNLSASARAVGFTAETIFERRRKRPGFAKRIEAAMEDAEIVMEFRLATWGNVVDVEMGTVTFPRGGADPVAAAGESDCPSPPFDPEFALKFLKWREEKRRGGGRRGRGDLGPPVPSIEEIRERIVHRVQAIKRHRDRYGPSKEAGENGDGK